MRKFKYCIIFFSVVCVSSLFAQGNYRDSRIFGTWRSVIFLKDIYNDIPTELRGVRAVMEITFAEDWSYYMIVNTAEVEAKLIKSLFGGHSKRTYKGRSYDTMVVEGKYYFDGEKLYIDDSDSRYMYLHKAMIPPDLWEDISNQSVINISWDVKNFTLKKYPGPFPAIVNTFIATRTSTDLELFTNFHKVR